MTKDERPVFGALCLADIEKMFEDCGRAVLVVLQDDGTLHVYGNCGDSDEARAVLSIALMSMCSQKQELN